MITRSTFLSAIAGAAIASCTWYFVSTPVSAGNGTSEPTATKSIVQSLQSESEDEVCEIRKDHAITWAQAQTKVGAYFNNGSTPHLTYDGTNTLKGFYIDRCIIEDLFRIYPQSDGIQLYIGLNTPSGQPAYNELVWMASQLTKVGNDFVRMNCIDSTNTIMDLLNPCPQVCPQINNLP